MDVAEMHVMELGTPLTDVLGLETGHAKSCVLGLETHASIRAQRGRGPLRVEDIGLIALGEKQKATWIKTPIKVQSQSLPSTNRCTIRVAAPAEYREAFLEGTDKTKAVVAHMSQFVQDIQTSTLMGGTWTEQWHNNKKHLIGFLHVPSRSSKQTNKNVWHSGHFYQHPGTTQHQQANHLDSTTSK